jgi:ankyrin repeat protein
VNAFWIAAWFGRVETMRKLLSMHVDAHATNQNGSNALHIAVKLGHAEVVRELIRLKNFPVDATKKNGVTAAGIAAFRGNIEMM